MSAYDSKRAQALLSSFVGKTLSLIECDEHQLRLVFEEGFQFVTHSPWRLFLDEAFLLGNGDVGRELRKGGLDSLRGLRLISSSLSQRWDTSLSFQNDHVLEVISNSFQYETWEAHLDVGWVVFANGQTTLFPPSRVANVNA